MAAEPPGPRLVPVPDDHGADFNPSTICDMNAERAVLGAAMLDSTVIDECATVITGTDFYNPRHGPIWYALRTLHASGRPCDPIALLDELRTRSVLREGDIDAIYLVQCIEAAPTAANGPHYAGIVARLAVQRNFGDAGTRMRQVAERESFADPAALDRALSDVRELISDVETRTTSATVRTPNIDEFLGGNDEEDYDWVIPGLLERHDRVILTGLEGGGKSTLLRQWGIMAAAGLDPFTGEPTNPITVLHVDLENSRKQSRRKFRPMRIQAKELDPTRHYVEVRPSGLDLLDQSEHAWLLDVVDRVKPDLLLTGPIYRMASGDPNEEKTAKAVSHALDRVRERGTAIVIEAHTPHAINGARKRPHRPYGASLWMRWPEFGIYLDEDGSIHHWRGARDERTWPTLLNRGGEWPWTAVTDERAIRWITIRNTRMDFGSPMSVRDLAEATGISKSTIARVITGDGPYRTEWDTLNADTNPPNWHDR